MPATKKKTRRAAPKRKVARRAAATRSAVSLEAASASNQKKLFRALRQVMKEFGVQGDVAALHVTSPAAKAATGCPPGQVSRVVCVKQPDGTVECHLECQPI